MPEPADDQSVQERQFRALYQEHYAAIWAYAVRRLAVPADVADVVADTFTIAWRRLRDVPPPPADRLWLFGVARRVVAGHRRSVYRRNSLFARLAASLGRPGEAVALPGTSDGDRVIEALHSLRPGEREALLLVVWDQLSYGEAASVLGCSQNAVAIRVHRAKTRLRMVLTPPGGRPAAPRLTAGIVTKAK